MALLLSYILCTLAALACTVLLARGYRHSGFRLLFWSALCFFGFFLANLMVIVDTVMFPHINLYPLRTALWIASLMVLNFGLIWESK